LFFYAKSTSIQAIILDEKAIKTLNGLRFIYLFCENIVREKKAATFRRLLFILFLL